MEIVLLSNEYPPNTYGGAGVHVDYLSKELALLEDANLSLKVFCFGQQKETKKNIAVKGISPAASLPFQDIRHKRLLDSLYRNVIMAGSVKRADIVHCHTWYTQLAGCLLKQMLGATMVLTTHSLEPNRPWKEEQLGSGYQASKWIEKTALDNADGIIAVSHYMKNQLEGLYYIPSERIRVIYNGIDTDRYKPTFNAAVLNSYGINPEKPFVLFVGRITHQKGIIHLIDAIPLIHPGIQIVLCAGAPDTHALGRQLEEKVKLARSCSQNEIIWISEVVPQNDLLILYSHATVFVCPSIYEPFGIINLEAMACGTPVVGSAVGGIPEVIVDNETGLLVPIETISPHSSEPKDPRKFSNDLATAVNHLVSSSEKTRDMGVKARERVERIFSWRSIARETLTYYRDLVNP